MFGSCAARFLIRLLAQLSVLFLCCNLLRAQLTIPPGGGTVQLPAGTYTIGSTLTVTSNLDIECSPNNLTILQASPTLKTDMIAANDVSHFRIFGCVLDGNRSQNTNKFSLLTLNNANHVEIVANHFQNTYTRCLYIHSGNSNIRVADNEFEYCGEPLPVSVGAEGIDLGLDNTGTGNSHILITNNQVHDNNIGIGVYPSTTSATVDIDISGNRTWSNANDGIMLYSHSSSFAPLQNVRITYNETFCNGYANNSNWNTKLCPPGKLQTGSIASSSGVGINVNSVVVDRPLLIGNSSHDNYFEGFDVTPLTQTVVTCNGSTTITYVSGDPFLTTWRTNQAVHMYATGINYLVQSVNGPRTSLTVSTACPTMKATPMYGVAYSRATVVGNSAFRNGNGRTNKSASGHGFGDIGIGDSYTGNISYDNLGCGFLDSFDAEVSHIGDRAFNNNSLGGFCKYGFVAQAALAPFYSGITTDDTSGTGHQSAGLLFDSQTTNAYASSGSLCGSTGCGSVEVSGAGSNGNIFTTGSNALGLVSFANGVRQPVNTLANLPACNSTTENISPTATNCSAACSSGSTCSGGGTIHCQLYCNGSAYVETGR
jgi:hypothetical protein